LRVYKEFIGSEVNVYKFLISKPEEKGPLLENLGTEGGQY
jgi:hypothetical protein